MTAAHCIVKYGTRDFATNAEYVPAYDNGTAPYGRSDVAKFSGFCCLTSMERTIATKGGTRPVPRRHRNPHAEGEERRLAAPTGWFGVGYDGYGFTALGQALIDQLGYPAALDKAELMERNDAQGSISAADLSYNTIIGSLMTEGASGGPWLVNLGVTPTPSPFLPLGSNAAPLVVGVASWITKTELGEVTRSGASPFKVTNVQALIIGACADTPAACKCTIKGRAAPGHGRQAHPSAIS